MNLQFYELFTRACMALMGWEEHDYLGQKVWLHVSGFVVYQQ